jgi:hypothetical protein
MAAAFPPTTQAVANTLDLRKPFDRDRARPVEAALEKSGVDVHPCDTAHELLTLSGIQMSHRTHIIIPEPLVEEIDRVVGKRGRSAFLAQAAEKELRRLRQIRALEKSAGAWKDKDHPELEGGAARWVKSLRKESDRHPPKSGRA